MTSCTAEGEIAIFHATSIIEDFAMAEILIVPIAFSKEDFIIIQIQCQGYLKIYFDDSPVSVTFKKSIKEGINY